LGETIEITGGAIANLDLLHAMQQGFVWRRRVRSGYRSSEQL